MSVEQIGRYQVTSELGKGAMGVVYKALDPTIGRVVALKTMRFDVSGMDSEELLGRLRNEARSAGVLNHPNIVTIYDAGEQDGLFYIAMEYIEGQTLHSMLLEKRMFPVDQTIDIARQVCAGLDYAHAHGVVHRDIKPANIMITSDGTAKIMDFGIAKTGGGVTSTGQVLGTPNYMSPEQVKGKPLDGRSDLFSVGVIVYEMLTGEKPFAGQNVTTVIYKIVNENPIAPRELDVTVHPGLSAVVTKALAKDPGERYSTGGELARDLQDYKSFEADTEATVLLNADAYTLPSQPVSVTAARAAPAATRPVAVLTAKAHNVVSTARKAASNARFSLISVVAGIALLAIAAAGAGLYRHAITQRHQPAQGAPAPQQKAQLPIAQANSPVAAQTAAADAQPAQSKAQPNNTGELRVESSPAGANVQIDSRSRSNWRTPMTISRLTPGPHTVTLSKTGFVSEIRGVDIETGKRTLVDIKLPSSRPLLALNSTPEGAEVIIDGQPTGMLTPAEINVGPGDHTLMLRRSGFESASTIARVIGGQRFKFSPTLTKHAQGNLTASRPSLAAQQKTIVPDATAVARGAVQIRTIPKGAEIVVNGFTLPRRSPLRLPLRAGKYEIVLRLEGYKPVQKTVEIVKNNVVRISEVLEPR